MAIEQPRLAIRTIAAIGLSLAVALTAPSLSAAQESRTTGLDSEATPSLTERTQATSGHDSSDEAGLWREANPSGESSPSARTNSVPLKPMETTEKQLTLSPTESPNSEIVPGQMRSDREPVPYGFSKEEADRAEILEAGFENRRVSTARALQSSPGCQVFWPSPYTVCGEILTKYLSLGGPNGFLLLPKTNELTNPDGIGKRTEFINGPIYWHPATGAHPVANHFHAKWGQLGWEAGILGYPTSDEIRLPDGIGIRQEFQGAAIYWRLNEAFAIGGEIRTKWNSVGAEQGPLGYPATDELSASKNNGRYNNFDNGTITWSESTGARLLYGAIKDRWAALGREDGPLGYPVEDESSLQGGLIHSATFENDTEIWWSQLTGARDIAGQMLGMWRESGGATGDLGLPVGNPLIPATGSSVMSDGVALVGKQMFQNGGASHSREGEGFVGVHKASSEPIVEDYPEEALASAAGEEGPSATAMAAHNSAQEMTKFINPHYPQDDMVIRRGFYNETLDRGFGFDKAGYKHNINSLPGMEFALRSPYTFVPRNAGAKGFVAYARRMECSIYAPNSDCRLTDELRVLSIYQPNGQPEYHGEPAGDPVGLLTMYCSIPPDQPNREKCPSWVDRSLTAGR